MKFTSPNLAARVFEFYEDEYECTRLLEGREEFLSRISSRPEPCCPGFRAIICISSMSNHFSGSENRPTVPLYNVHFMPNLNVLAVAIGQHTPKDPSSTFLRLFVMQIVTSMAVPPRSLKSSMLAGCMRHTHAPSLLLMTYTVARSRPSPFRP